MAHTAILGQTALANVFLHSFKTTAERIHAVRELSKQLDNDSIGLVAALTAQEPDAEADSNLRSFLAHAIDRGDPSSAASLSLQYPRLREALLDRATQELLVSLSLLLRRPKHDGLVTFAFQAIAPSSLDHLSLDKYAADHADRSAEDIVNTTLVHLNFMRQLFRLSAANQSYTISQPMYQALLALLPASNKHISLCARDACFAFLAAYRKHAVTVDALQYGSDALDRHLWHCIDSLLNQTSHTSYRTTAYAIWLRWLEMPNAPHLFEDAMQSDKYWVHLLNALASGDVEQRKLCLHILRTSVATLRKSISTKDMKYEPAEAQHGSNSVQAHYERFCTVYETIVVGRYFNQAEECMRDLDALASSQTKVQHSWLFALLEPAMSNVVQDSIRKMLGNWLMSTDLRVSTHATEFSRFLRNSFLPWACLGPLFTGSLRGRTRSMRCEHGMRLAKFIERLVQNHSADEQTEVRLCIVQSILNFLLHNKAKVIPYAIIYILHGLDQGLKGNMLPCLGAAELDILLGLTTGTAYPEISRDVFQSYCWELAQLCTASLPQSSITTASEDLRLDSLTRKVQQIRLASSPDNALAASNWHSLEDYLEELHASRHNCLSGQKLPKACEHLIVLLDTLDSTTINVDQLCETLDSIWTGLEIQDYPKNTLLVLPRLVMHPKVIACSLSEKSLAEMLESYMLQLHQLASGRIYIWAPFMAALRNALLRVPAATRHFAVSDLIVETANKPPSAKVEFQLEAAAVELLFKFAGGRKYSDYYGDHEEEGYAAFYDTVNRLPFIDEDLAREVYDRLMDPWVEQKMPVPIVNKWKTTLQLQIMLILQEQLLPSMTVSQTRNHMDKLHMILAIEPLPRYRLLIEWQIARTIVRHMGTSDDVLQRLSTMDHHSNPKYLSSLTKIALMVARLENCPEDFASRLSCRLVALSASSKIIIRHEAQWSFPILWDAAELHGWGSITSNPACQALNAYIRSLQQFSKPPAERLLEHLDPVSGHDLANLLQGDYLRLEPPAVEIVSVLDLQRLVDKDLASGSVLLPNQCLPLGNAPAKASSEQDDPLPTAFDQQDSKASARTAATTALQTKGTAYLSANSTKTEESARATDLIVVASLVDNAYNLGGLSRISEIFGASALYMSRPKVVLGNKDFVSVAVASQNHLPIHDLSVENLQAFLTEKKMQGYTVVGVEQTDRSVMLGDESTKLPAKTLLVMGAEKEGIPALVLGECDILVEVPQRGVTRSMNVQTAAGVVLYEYSRQHHTK